MSDAVGPDPPKRHSRLAAFASRQWGAISRRQLLALGYSTDEIRGMLERGLLHRVHRGVYVFGAPSPAPEQRWAAALIAAGPGAALSHTSAAGVHGLLPVRNVIEVVAPKQRRGDARLRVHRRNACEATMRRGLKVTTVAQTLLDLAAASWPIDRLTQEAAASGLVPLDDLRAFAASRRGARGAAKLAEAAGQPLVRSRLEARALRELGVPEINARVGADEVDLVWREAGVVVEIDHDQTHGTKWARQRDARKDQRLRERGVRVERFTV